MSEPIKTSMSEISVFTRCAKKWDYQYLRGLQMRVKPEVMGTGTLYHVGAAAGYRHWKESKTSGVDLLWPEAAHAGVVAHVESEAKKAAADDQEFQYEPAQIDLVHDMLDFYWEHQGSKETFEEILSIEEPVTYEFEGYSIRSTFDLLVRQRGMLWLTDWKTVGTVKETFEFLPLDFQVNEYMLAAHRQYREPVGLKYSGIRREVPPGFGHRPEYNEGVDKNGKAWRRKSTASTDPADYLRSEPILKSQFELEAFEHELRGTLSDQRHAKETGFFRRSPIKSGGMACKNCAYFGLCTAELYGRTVDQSILNVTFKHGGDPRDAESVGVASE